MLIGSATFKAPDMNPCHNCHPLSFMNLILNPWCRVFLEKFTVSQLIKKFPPFMVPEYSLLLIFIFSQNSSVESNLHPQTLVSLKDPLSYFPPFSSYFARDLFH
jgi:hypothetical protein